MLWQCHSLQADEVDPQLRKLLKNAVERSDSFTDKFDAEVWLLDMSTRLKRIIKDDKERLTILRNVHKEAKNANLQPELVLALIHTESHFDHFAISVVGARGLMQVMPFWRKEIGHPNDNLHEITTNLRYGCTILRYYLDMEKGDIPAALARYNGSRGSRKYSDKVLRLLSDVWFVQ